MKQALTLKYRPTTFEDVVGQNIVSTILKKVVATKTFKNAYLLCGKSGCGKTTLARIFANAINGGTCNPIEINAASTNGVDDIRDIIDSAQQRSLDSEYKVFIIDECHMLGGGNKEKNGAWSALLKCIEECPKYTIFIFCTTDTQRIPDTILNRVQRYNIAPISCEEIKQRLMYICKQEGFTNYEESCDLISRSCNNGMRDAITLLDQCADYSTNLTFENVKAVLGVSPYETMFNLTCAILNKDQASVLTILNDCEAAGINLKTFINSYLAFSIDLAKYCLFNSINLTSIPKYLEKRCDGFSHVPNALAFANMLTDQLLDLKSMLRYDTSIKSTVEAYLIRLIRSLGE